MGLPLGKAAPHVITMHIGGAQRKGPRESQGQSLELNEQVGADSPHQGQGGKEVHPYEPSRTPAQKNRIPERPPAAQRGALNLMGMSPAEIAPRKKIRREKWER